MKASCRMLPKVDPRHRAASKTQASTVCTRFMLLVFLLGVFPALTRDGFAQAPLNFANNFFVTGDYVVAGAYNMTSNFTTINGTSYAVGTINVPDSRNPGIQGVTQVPKGAQIVAALLYWQSVEIQGLQPGAPGTGANGYFRPLLYSGKGGPAAPGYSIQGTALDNENINPVPTGCSGTSNGKVIQTYRADVAGGFPNDASGNPVANGSFEVRLPSTKNGQPFTLGATLVIIYRIPTGPNGPSIPLNSIVIYDGDYAQNNTHPNMSQQLQGFYDADAQTISRLTHIVGSGASNKFETVYLGSANPLAKLSSPYGSTLPSFPGWYGNWDNPTWTFPKGSSPLVQDSSIATTQVVRAAQNQACVSWGAVIVSTTVKNSDGDGLLDSWKANSGYCDVGTASLPGVVCKGPGDQGWIDLPEPHVGSQDIYLQYDYMCTDVTGPGTCHTSTVNDPLNAVAAASGGKTTYTGTFSPAIPAGTLVGIAGFKTPANNGQFTVQNGSTTSQLIVNNPAGVAENDNPGVATYQIQGDQNYSFDPRLAVDAFDGSTAVDKVVNAFADKTHHNEIYLHPMPGNAISETSTYGLKNGVLTVVPATCTDTDLTCPFPNEPGTVGFREGLAYIKNQTIEPSTGLLGCDPNSDPNPCVAVFAHGKKDSYHYALFSHGVGLPSLYLSDGSIKSVQQTGNIVTFTTLAPHGISPILADPKGATATDNTCKLGRVTVVYAITNPNLEGTYCVLSSPAPTANTFSIQVGGPSMKTTNYTAVTDPNLAVANGQVTSMSGFSDVGGQNSVISLGYGNWGPPSDPFTDGNKWPVKAGTFMHEFGHTLGLTHGGTFYNNYNPSANPPVLDYTPNFETNCKPNVQSIMSYVFQFDLLQVPGRTNSDGSPLKVVDYSEDPPTNNPELVNTLSENIPEAAGVLDKLSTYANTSWFQLTSFNGATPASSHCDGTMAPANPSYSYTNQPVSDFFWGLDPITLQPTGNDINFNGGATEVMHPHNEWEGTPTANGVGPSPGIDLRQISAVGTISTIGPGGEAGGLKPAGGGGGLKPAGGGGGLKPAGGGGGLKPAGGGGGLKPAGGGGLSAEINHNQANSYPRPPQGLFIVQEEASPRFIDLSWFAATFGTAVNYKVYRSDAGGPFNLLPSGTAPGSQTTFQDTVTCNPAGYRYQVKAVTLDDQGNQQTSSPSNTVPDLAAGEPKLTGCYTSPVAVAVEASGVQGDIVPVTWTLTDDFFTPAAPWSSATPGNAVTKLAASTNKISAIGPVPPSGGACPAAPPDNAPTTLLSSAGFDADNNNVFTFHWDTDTFNAGCYFVRLDLDSGQFFTSAAIQLSIDVGDQEPRITTPSLPAGTVGLDLGNNDPVKEDGGTAPFMWSFSGLPIGISFSPGNPVNANQITLSGSTCVAGTYNPVTATVTDAKSNSGTQNFSLQINQATTTTTVASNAPPPSGSFFQEPVTFTVTVAPQYGCTPTGTVTLLDGGGPIVSASNLPLTGGKATFMTSALSVGVHNITASYSGDNNFTGSSSTVLQQTVNRAQTMIVAGPVLPSPLFVGQPMTVSWTLSVVAPGAGSPVVPTGSITVTASDGSACASQPPTSGMCTLSPAPTAAGNNTFTITYSGDGNFFGTADPNVNYTVYKLVFTTQPSNTGVGNTITPAVVVTAEDSSNGTLGTFTGPVTVAIAAGPGSAKLAGTFTQNAVAGVATFNDLSINQIANGYMLTASPTAPPAPAVVSATSNAFNIDTFYVDSSGNFGTLDLQSGTVTQIGDTPTPAAPGSNGIDLTPGLSVFAYNASNQLMSIAPSTGVATQVGSGTTGSIPPGDQATSGALTNGSYFAIDAVTGILYSIDTTAGTTTQVVTTPTPTGAAVLPAGCTLDSSLTGSATVLYYTIGYSGASCMVNSQPAQMPDTLYQIDPTTGLVTASAQLSIGSAGGPGVNEFVGSAFVGGTLYGFTSSGQIYSIVPSTGVATSLVSTTPTTSIIGAGGQ